MDDLHIEMLEAFLQRWAQGSTRKRRASADKVFWLLWDMVQGAK